MSYASTNQIENVTKKQLAALKGLATHFLSYSENRIKEALKLGELYEVE